MINTIVPIESIEYEPEPVSAELLESIRTRGIAIPVRVNETERGYRCEDGRKRLSACALLLKEDPRFSRIPIMILNDFRKAGSSFWGNTQNHH